MEISVIIPSYKPGKYLWECLDSLSKQTLSNDKFETILILNGCCEPWKSRIDTWIASHPEMNINFIQTDTPGVSNARNIGIEAAKGEYIAFIDDDDFVSPQYLAELLKVSSKECVGLSDSRSFHDGERVFSTNYYLHNVFDNCSKSSSSTLFKARSMFNGPCMKLISKSIIGKKRFNVNLSNGEDNLMMLNISDRIKRIRFTSPDAIYYRRYRDNSAITRHHGRAEWMLLSVRVMWQYMKCIAKCPWKYNYPFIASRFAAEIKAMFM